ncbi:MAG TPA: TatD family hydrolase [Desulfosalsimonadaceae bacterium]|nr:TatD family hydrolase [Desulfosalsimonadaceae bacterium]
MQVLDSHVHLDHIAVDHPERLRWMRDREYFPVSWAFCRQVESVSGIRGYLAQKAEIIRELNRHQLPCRFLAGIHPRNIVSGLRPESVRELVLPYLETPLCLGIGEIGLESADSQECEVLCAHLELFRETAELGLVCGIHTPRADKAARTRTTLDLLSGYRDLGSRIVVDHCMPETIAGVLAEGFRAGITLSPVKAGEAEVMEIIARHGERLSRIMINTDSGADFFEDLYNFSRSADVAPEIREQLVRANAVRFYGLENCA